MTKAAPVIHRFAATEHVEVTGRGTMWAGYSPFKWRRDLGVLAWAGLWMIDHPDADPNKIYRVVAVESHCLMVIRQGARIGLVFEEVMEK